MTEKELFNEAHFLRLEFPHITAYESLDIAIKLEQLKLFRAAFVISSTDSLPSALEAIAIQLGFKANQ